MSTRIDRWLNLVTLAGAILLSMAGCSTTNPKPKMPQPAAPLIKVDGEALPALDFDRIILDIPDKVAIGYHYEGIQYSRRQAYWWDENFAHETDELNGKTRTILAEAGYRTSAGDPGAMRLVGTLGRVGYNTYDNKVGFAQAECEMTWQLYGAGADQPHFSTVTNGAGRVGPNEPGALREAYEVALRQLLADPEFAAAVAGLVVAP
jgi:hypothetical protein